MTDHAAAHRRLIQVSRVTCGVFNLDMARACGVSRRMVTRLLERGQIERVHLGVYRYAHVPLTAKGQLHAALAAIGRVVVASHTSAAMLHGLSEVGIATPELTVLRDEWVRIPRLHRVRVHETRTLPAEDITIVHGASCTTGTRTLIDLCPRFEPARNIARTDDAICRGIAERSNLHKRAKALSRGRRGVGNLVRITAPDAEGVFWSALERRFGEAVRRSDLPMPVFNAPVDVGGRRYYADALWPGRRLVTELHGLAFHSRPGDRADDDARLNAFTMAGLRCLVFTWRDVHYESDKVHRTLAGALLAA